MFVNNLVLQLWSKMLAANQIAAFFNHQYFWKEPMDILDFLLGDNHQRNAASETITFCLV